MSFEGIDEWDENFLNEAIRIEVEAVSSRSLAAPGSQPVPAVVGPAAARPQEEALPSAWFDGAHAEQLSFSPPRELSQRFPEDCEIIGTRAPRKEVYRGRGGAKKDGEVERLKRELGHVSKQLSQLEHECKELQKDRAKKDKELQCAFSEIEAKDAEIHSLRRANMEASKQNHTRSNVQLQAIITSSNEAGCQPISAKHTPSFPVADERRNFHGKSKRAIEPGEQLSEDMHMFECDGPKQKDIQADGPSAVCELQRRITVDNGLTTSTAVSSQKTAPSMSSKAAGVQTDFQDCNHHTPKDALFPVDNTSIKLHAIWGFPGDRKSGRDMVSKLLAVCSADFCELFRSMSMPFQTNLGTLADERSGDMVHNGVHLVHSSDAAKISQLNAVLMKMHKGMAELHSLLEALLGLCGLDNVVIAHRSLHILRIILQNLLSCEVVSDQRNNVLLDLSQDIFPTDGSAGEKNQISKFLEFGKAYNECETSVSFLSWVREFDLENVQEKRDQSCGNSAFLSLESWISLFDTMQEIVKKNTEEYVQIEALSIMNLIMMRSNPNSERDKFQLLPLLVTISHLLQKEVGLHVQLQAVRLLFLILNCQKILVVFCSGQRESSEQTETVHGQNDASAIQKAISCILQGLAECLYCKGTAIQELKLQRHVIITLALIASSSKFGFEILINPVTSHGVSFLELIIQVLASEVDAELGDFAASQDFYKERTSMMRQALILLNRLASHPAYSKTALGVLTSGSSTASFTIDVANRLSWKGRGWGRQDATKKMQLEVEIVDLAQIFRTRVFAFLGESIS